MASVKEKSNDSPCRKAILKVKELYMAGRKVEIQTADVARLWKDPLVDNIPLNEKFPLLFNICNFQDCTVNKCLDVDVNTFFRRWLSPELGDQRNGIFAMARNLCTSNNGDIVKWALGSKTSFTTKSLYDFLDSTISESDHRWIWKARTPLKVQIFLWQFFQDVVLTRDVMSRRIGRVNLNVPSVMSVRHHIIYYLFVQWPGLLGGLLLRIWY